MKRVHNNHILILSLFILSMVAVLTLSSKRDQQTKMIKASGASHINTPTYSAAPPENIYEHEILRFAVIADPHIGQNINGSKEGNSIRLEQAIEVAKQHNVEFFVALGDITQTGSTTEFEEAKRILDAGNVTYYTAIGNHDVFQNQNTYEKYFGAKSKKVAHRLRKGAPSTYKPIDPIADLVFLNLSEAQAEYGDVIGKDQSEWLDKEMKINQSRNNKLLLVFSGGALNTLESNQKEKISLYLCQSNITAFIIGGPHRYYAQFSPCYFDWLYKQDTRVPNYYEISPSTIGEFSYERSAQVSIIHVFPDFRVEVERIPIGVNPIYPEYIE